MKIYELAGPDAITWAKAQSKRADSNSKELLGSQLRMWVFRGDRLFGVERGGELVHLSAFGFSSAKRKNAWGRYIRYDVAYTDPDHRRCGVASACCTHVEGVASFQGYDRLKSLAMSIGGVRLHMALGHTFYGISPAHELIVDSALNLNQSFPEGVPLQVRNNKGPVTEFVPYPDIATQWVKNLPIEPTAEELESIQSRWVGNRSR